MVLITVFIILFLDQLTKFFVTKFLVLNRPVPVIRGFLYFTLVHNRGAAFGIFRNQLPLFIITSIIAIVLIYASLKKNKQRGISVYNIALCLILAGALGNLVDRIAFGYVIDFLDLRVWPVFNVADSAITVGAVLLGYSILRAEKTQNSKLKTQK